MGKKDFDLDKELKKLVWLFACWICFCRPDVIIYILLLKSFNMLAGAAFPAAFFTRKSGSVERWHSIS